MLINSIIELESQVALEPSVYWKAFVNSAEGNLVLNELSSLYWTKSLYNKNQPADQMAYFEGQRSVITHVLRVLAQSQQPIEDITDE